MKMKMKMKVVFSWPSSLIFISLLLLLFVSISSQDLNKTNSQPKKKKKMQSLRATKEEETKQRSRRSNWGYTNDRGDIGVRQWKDVYPLCGGENQSPIDIVIEESSLDAELFSASGFGFVGYEEVSPTDTYLLTNTGHSVRLTINGSSMYYEPIGLPGSYRLDQVHFHWGSTDYYGAEHHIDGYSHPLEIHFVHYSVRYGSFNEALLNPQGLAIVAVFADTEHVSKDNFGIDNIVSHIDYIKFKDTKPLEIRPFKLSSLLRGIGVEYFRYNGSLTTPGCHESVTWTVFRKPIDVTNAQMDKFRRLRSGRSDEMEVTLQDNFRPIQKLGQRKVIRNFISPGERNNDVTYVVLLNLVIADAFVLLIVLVVMTVCDGCLRKRPTERKEEAETVQSPPVKRAPPPPPASPASPAPSPASPGPRAVLSTVSVPPSTVNAKQPSKVVITTQHLPRSLSTVSAAPPGNGPR